jgi:hypothetical protein
MKMAHDIATTTSTNATIDSKDISIDVKHLDPLDDEDSNHETPIALQGKDSRWNKSTYILFNHN